MPRHTDTEDDWDEDEEDASFDDPEDDEPTVPCPHCREEMHEDAEQCPHCGQYVSEEDAPPARKPWWIILGAILGLIAVYLWFGH